MSEPKAMIRKTTAVCRLGMPETSNIGRHDCQAGSGEWEKPTALDDSSMALVLHHTSLFIIPHAVVMSQITF